MLAASLFDGEPDGKPTIQNETVERQTFNRLKVLEALQTAVPGEDNDSIAARAGVSRATFYRYMKDPAFQRLLQERFQSQFTAARLPVQSALIRNARLGSTPDIRTFFQLTGELRSGIELSGPKGGPVEVKTISPESLPPELRESLYNFLKDKVTPPPEPVTGLLDIEAPLDESLPVAALDVEDLPSPPSLPTP